jgi:hypothetical protein
MRNIVSCADHRPPGAVEAVKCGGCDTLNMHGVGKKRIPKLVTEIPWKAPSLNTEIGISG